MKEILRGVIFLHRVIDDKDFNEVVNCIPDKRMKDLEAGLIERQVAGEIDTVQIARHRKEAHPLSEDVDQVDIFFKKIDSKRPHSSTERTPESESGDARSDSV
jgi:hypothetical protein